MASKPYVYLSPLGFEPILLLMWEIFGLEDTIIILIRKAKLSTISVPPKEAHGIIELQHKGLNRNEPIRHPSNL